MCTCSNAHIEYIVVSYILSLLLVYDIVGCTVRMVWQALFRRLDCDLRDEDKSGRLRRLRMSSPLFL